MIKILSKLTGKPAVVLLVVVILVLTIVQLILSNHLANSGGKLSQILTEIESLERENRDLGVQIYQKGSVSRLKELAQNLGFLEPRKFFFVKESFLVAENR